MEKNSGIKPSIQDEFSVQKEKIRNLGNSLKINWVPL